MKYIYQVFVVIFLLFISLSLNAHAPNQSYIFIKVYKDSVGGHYEVTTTDLNKVLGFNLSKTNNEISSLQKYLPEIKNYILEHLAFSSVKGKHEIQLSNEIDLLPSSYGDFIVFNFKLDNDPQEVESLTIEYDGIFEKDTEHRGLQVVAYNWKAGILDNEAMVSLTFGPDKTKQNLNLSEGVSLLKGFMMMVDSGIHHIRIGIDHILFLLALILPGVVRRQRREDEDFVASEEPKGFLMKYSAVAGIWKPVAKFRPAIMYILMIVTFFTIAHSITLSAAALGYINLPSRIVESIIAFSIALAAFHNIRPIFKRDWMIAFLFGLFHGFGFASVLGEVGLSGDYMVLSLLGFNVGVEVGQIMIIALIFPILYLIRNLKIYPKILIYGSVVLIFIALYWFTERAFDIDLSLGRYVVQPILNLFK